MKTMPDVRSKIFKSANNKSIMDVTSALLNFDQNKFGENVYKGKVVFSITVLGNNGGYGKAFVSKHQIKPMLDMIKTHHFHRFYGEKGFTVYGGSMKDGKVTARIFSIRFTDRQQFHFKISEGEGAKTGTGGFKMVKPNLNVEKYLSYEEGLQMAHEISDYIHQAEMRAMIAGQPLYTEMPVFHGGQQNQPESPNVPEKTAHQQEPFPTPPEPFPNYQ